LIWTLKIFFAWYDLWLGLYVDVKGKALYLCPLPCCVIKLAWGFPGWRRLSSGVWERSDGFQLVPAKDGNGTVWRLYIEKKPVVVENGLKSWFVSVRDALHYVEEFFPVNK
jgi:hypothetical protein